MAVKSEKCTHIKFSIITHITVRGSGHWSRCVILICDLTMGKYAAVIPILLTWLKYFFNDCARNVYLFSGDKSDFIFFVDSRGKVSNINWLADKMSQVKVTTKHHKKSKKKRQVKKQVRHSLFFPIYTCAINYSQMLSKGVVKNVNTSIIEEYAFRKING